ncbi:serine/threonine dehydratase [Opacimonas viscosa]|uniref:Serine/threonine dehydratase n=1 Tax=Opacimonas viscosa TaxID=2961944 RepID=A0AA41WZJ8_9ALTE|nr:serine/threonine dehydratase [Opacimonas viscosa]
MSLPTFSDVLAAQERIADIITPTPIVASSLLNSWLGHKVLFKAECLQRTGAFKLRGASNFLLKYQSEYSLPNHVVANSSGNHAQAVAYAGAQLGCPVTIFSTANISTVKAAATTAYGASLQLYPTRPEADKAVQAAAQTEGTVWIPPFNHPDIIAGQGTASAEAFMQAQQQGAKLDAIFAPCGGGGLVSGAVLAAQGLSPSTAVIGVEPEVANDASISLQQNEIYTLKETPITLADGAATPAVGDITFQFLQQLDGFYEVNETQIAYWTQWLHHLLKLHIEPTCCMTMAGVVAWLSEQTCPKTVMVILSGGNISHATMQQIHQQDFLEQPPFLD